MKWTTAIAIVAVLVSAAFAGCTGGGEKIEESDTGTDKAVRSQAEQKLLFPTVEGKRTYDFVTSVTETITSDNRENAGTRQRSVKALRFAIEELEEADAKSFEWDFGDGTTESGFEASHVYSSPGVFFASLTVTFHDGSSKTRAITIYVNYHAEGKDKVSGLPCKGYDKNGEDYWDYLFPVAAGAKEALIQTFADPADAPVYPTVPLVGAGDNDIGLEVYSVQKKLIGKSDGETGGENPADETVKLKEGRLGEAGDYLMRVGCFDGIGGDHHFVNAGEVSYLFSIDIIYYIREE